MFFIPFSFLGDIWKLRNSNSQHVFGKAEWLDNMCNACWFHFFNHELILLNLIWNRFKCVGVFELSKIPLRVLHLYALWSVWMYLCAPQHIWIWMYLNVSLCIFWNRFKRYKKIQKDTCIFLYLLTFFQKIHVSFCIFLYLLNRFQKIHKDT